MCSVIKPDYKEIAFLTSIHCTTQGMSKQNKNIVEIHCKIEVSSLEDCSTWLDCFPSNFAGFVMDAPELIIVQLQDELALI